MRNRLSSRWHKLGALLAHFRQVCAAQPEVWQSPSNATQWFGDQSTQPPALKGDDTGALTTSSRRLSRHSFLLTRDACAPNGRTDNEASLGSRRALRTSRRKPPISAVIYSEDGFRMRSTPRAQAPDGQSQNRWRRTARLYSRPVTSGKSVVGPND